MRIGVDSQRRVTESCPVFGYSEAKNVTWTYCRLFVEVTP
jgi:hypothetical protein